MLKQYVAFHEEKDGAEVTIYVSANCPLGFAHDAIFKARSYIIDKINEAEKADKPVEVSEQPKAE